MPATRVLFVKLSSLGDVIHHFPAVSDLARHRPDVEVHWAVEEAYAELVALHPAVTRAIPVNLRRLRKRLLSPSAWGALRSSRQALRAQAFDYIVDTQGLVKSGIVCRMAHGVTFGMDRKSAREKGAARFYDVPIAVPRDLHAVERNRRLVASVFGYALEPRIDYGLIVPSPAPEWAPATPYVVGLHATSRDDKLWPGERWIALAAALAARDVTIVYPGGSEKERAMARRLADASLNAVAAPAMSLTQAAALISQADAVVGVDTGLTHLAVALSRPTIGLYVATEPGRTGLAGGQLAVNLGGPGKAPTVDAVMQALFGPPPPAAEPDAREAQSAQPA
jgi:lipopolysaccharide heptosyltransferase I